MIEEGIYRKYINLKLYYFYYKNHCLVMLERLIIAGSFYN